MESFPQMVEPKLTVKKQSNLPAPFKNAAAMEDHTLSNWPALEDTKATGL